MLRAPRCCRSLDSIATPTELDGLLHAHYMQMLNCVNSLLFRLAMLAGIVHTALAYLDDTRDVLLGNSASLDLGGKHKA